MGTRAEAEELTTGEFARASGLSHKALRLYDANGLLRPARADPSTGYRYYTRAQTERARAIALLRRLDLPLARIGEILDLDAEAFAREVRGWWEDQVGSLSERRDAVDLLVETFGRTDPLGQGRPGAATPPTDPAAPAGPPAPRPGLPDVHAGDVRVRTVPALTVATSTSILAQEDLVAGFTAAVLLIRAHLAGEGAEFGNEYWVLFHGAVRPGAAAPIEVCVPYSGRVVPAEGIALRVEPAHREAYVDVTASDCRYPRIMAFYDALESWVAEHAERVGGTAGSVREVYPVPWAESGVVASIAQPVA
ncbi:transcriptional regulator, MerR family [Beutenbergia cavernae DSM 12333]|uniref:Transcriptional regulator, MerR family n=1 Tax=Beutenbergia cavernae (strain ATCC BAA-8 / DSM 12333 / CCUG 43141 / JCM 11478 / NBRC 16432 / NCIMB 13614 / HKI 0122) TaxID=471853 RepID=C5C3X2_BEUC1|nr:MerR family transcriptional regulator [Beutenbergia cavernae]ACQ79885.1 transcriptional regulator, MerR family [Beutenbergia cavernae DSM 12333]